MTDPKREIFYAPRAFLDRREKVWTRDWLEDEIERRATDPVDRLLAIFDVFDGWFRREGFEGCSFINVLLEANVGSPLHRASAFHLSKIRAIILGLAEAAGFVDHRRARSSPKEAYEREIPKRAASSPASRSNTLETRTSEDAAPICLLSTGLEAPEGWRPGPALPLLLSAVRWL